MSGHSKWATTKHKKAAIDAKRGKLFAKLIKNIEVAARSGGGDPTGNPTLYDAIQKAKKSSVPNDNIDRAVKRGSGAEAGGAEYSTIMYEGYGPNGVAFLIECLTDNKNRAAMEVRTAMSRNGGSLADLAAAGHEGADGAVGDLLAPVAHRGMRVEHVDDGLVLTLPLPLAHASDLGLQRRGDELLVAVGEHRRVLTLPAALALARSSSAFARSSANDFSFAVPASYSSIRRAMAERCASTCAAACFRC